MSRSHIKRLMMPRSWPLTRKTNIWAQKPNPAGHPLEMCMPLGILLRDILEVAHNMREAKRILQSRKVLVDGKVETNRSRGVNIIESDPSKYNVGDSLIISLPDQKISKHLQNKEGSLAFLTGGSHIGEIAVIGSLDIKRSSKPNETLFEDFGTISDYVFVIDKESYIPKEAES